MEDKRVLILDDEASILEILSQYLMEEGYDCTAATNPLVALQLLEEEEFHLLITDLKMPEMSGLEVVSRAKKMKPDLAVIVVTALLEAKNAIEAMRSGADDYLLKPFNLGEISLSVERALERRGLLIGRRRYREELEIRVREATSGLEIANRELHATKDYLENLLHSSADGILTIDKDDAVSFSSGSANTVLGRTEEELSGMPIATFLVGGVSEVRRLTQMLKEGDCIHDYETEFQHKAGHIVPVNMSLSLVRSPEGETISVLAICKDITKQKQLEAELKEMSISDSLSGLYNQGHFYDRLEAEIERVRRQNHPLSLLLFDVDSFKGYNDCLGHLEGDKVLKAIGVIVLECTRVHVDVCFRYGGDEFTVILPEADEAQAKMIAERIRIRFAESPFADLTLSIGLVTYNEGCSLRSFVRFADTMMYEAKRAGGNQVRVFVPDSTIDEDVSTN
jgi:two-component system, cell cycle response regulator